MKSFAFLVIISSLATAFAIEPIVIVHGGAGSVAASRVNIRNSNLRNKLRRLSKASWKSRDLQSHLLIGFSKIPGKYRGTKLAARIGYKVLNETGSVLDAVEQAVRSMELSADFNAGYGSVLTRCDISPHPQVA